MVVATILSYLSAVAVMTTARTPCRTILINIGTCIGNVRILIKVDYISLE